MSTPPFEVRPLRNEDRTNFDSGVDALNAYFQKQVGQDMKRRIASCFVAIHQDTQKIAGFYTLSASQIPLNELDEKWSRKLPKYRTVPAVLIGRLAIDQVFQKQGLGSGLIVDAVSRVMSSEIAATLLVVDAKDENAVSFYQHLGFQNIPDRPNKMVVPISVIAKEIGA